MKLYQFEITIKDGFNIFLSTVRVPLNEIEESDILFRGHYHSWSGGLLQDIPCESPFVHNLVLGHMSLFDFQRMLARNPAISSELQALTENSWTATVKYSLLRMNFVFKDKIVVSVDSRVASPEVIRLVNQLKQFNLRSTLGSFEKRRNKQKIVYRNFEIKVPLWARWIITQPDGLVYVYSDEPMFDVFDSGFRTWTKLGQHTRVKCVGRITEIVNVDSMNSLVRIDEYNQFTIKE